MEIRPEQLSSAFESRRLVAEDMEAVYALCRGNPGYYSRINMEVTWENIMEDLRELPPNKTRADKTLAGFFRAGRLVAVMDLIAAWPDESTCLISFFMVDSALQGRGVGGEIVRDVMNSLKEQGVGVVRLAYVRGSEGAKAFWLRNGFSPTGEERVVGRYDVIVLQRRLNGE